MLSIDCCNLCIGLYTRMKIVSILSICTRIDSPMVGSCLCLFFKGMDIVQVTPLRTLASAP